MVNTLFSVKAGARVAVLATALVQLGFAQMNGGMGGGMMGSGTPSNGATGMGGGMSGGMQGGMSGMGSGNGMMTSGPVVGPDGTAYVVRQAGGTSQQMMGGTQQATKTELVALNPQNGNANWTQQIDGTMVSEPVLAKDGTIFLTTSEPSMNSDAEQGGGMHSSNNSTSNTKPALVIITATVTSARVLNRVEIDADVLSVPRITPDGQTIYVVATQMPGMTSNASTSATGGSTLFGFGPNGALRFKVQLSQFQTGQGR
jgi:outer membrane protein assembly factor BamB